MGNQSSAGGSESKPRSWDTKFPTAQLQLRTKSIWTTNPRPGLTNRSREAGAQDFPQHKFNLEQNQYGHRGVEEHSGRNNRGRGRIQLCTYEGENPHPVGGGNKYIYIYICVCTYTHLNTYVYVIRCKHVVHQLGDC